MTSIVYNYDPGILQIKLRPWMTILYIKYHYRTVCKCKNNEQPTRMTHIVEKSWEGDIGGSIIEYEFPNNTIRVQIYCA